MISAVVFVCLAYLVVFVWYPNFFFGTDGGWEGLRILIFVDLVLGPCLTMVVYQAGKPGLKFDLTCIGILQSVCLLAGLYVVENERPTFLVFYGGHFYSVSNDTFKRYGQLPGDPAAHGDRSPVKVAATVPENAIEEADFRTLLYREGVPVWIYERSFEPLEQHMDQVLAEAFDLEALRSRDTEAKLDIWLEKYGGELTDYAFFPIHSRYQKSFIAIRLSNREFVGVLDIPAPLGTST
jgi:hypothetical protein